MTLFASEEIHRHYRITKKISPFSFFFALAFFFLLFSMVYNKFFSSHAYSFSTYLTVDSLVSVGLDLL